MAVHERQLDPRISEIPALLDWVAECCAGEDLPGDLTFKMTLALEEAVNNAISHAFIDRPTPHLLRVKLDITAESLTAQIVDNGSPFDPTTVPVPDLSLALAERRPGGLGIRLMRGLADRLRYSRSNGQNILWLEKDRR